MITVEEQLKRVEEYFRSRGYEIEIKLKEEKKRDWFKDWQEFMKAVNGQPRVREVV